VSEEGARFESIDGGMRAPDGGMDAPDGGMDAPGPGTIAPDGAASTPAGARSCAWCGTPATPEAANCPSCGAALAQRESIGDLAIPGLTTVDAALQDFDKRPLHLRGPSPSQGMAPALIVGAMAGGPIGLAAIGGEAAVAAAEYLGAHRAGGSGALEDVGRPSEVVLQALEHLDSSRSDSTGSEAQDPDAATAAADDGRSIWRDLPPVAPAFETLEDPEAPGQHEEGVADGR
jgi:hypothetical protein